LPPILDRLTVDPYDYVPNNCRADSFISNCEMNVRPVAAIEFEDRPDRRAHLLALHVRGVTANAQSEKSDKCRNNCFVSARAARWFFVHHAFISNEIADPVKA